MPVPLSARTAPRRPARGLATISCTLAFWACGFVGPRSVEHARGSYNGAIQRTGNEQLLMNLVRLRYVDTPLFLEVSSVTTQVRFETTAIASGKLPLESPNALELASGVEFAETPTVQYAPLQGDRFARQMLTPLELPTLVLLYRSGWPISRIFRVCLQRLNQIRNAPTAAGPTPEEAPAFQHFDEVAESLRTLQLRGALELGQIAGQSSEHVHVRIAPEAVDWPETRRLVDLLELAPGRLDYRLTTDVFDAGGDRIVVVPRSLMGSLFFLAQGVQPPEGDVLAGHVTITRSANGEAFDWRTVTGALLEVRSSALPPRGAHVAVRYRDSWFSISDDDVSSKTTFALLTQLFALQAGRIESRAPLLTLPMSR